MPWRSLLSFQDIDQRPAPRANKDASQPHHQPSTYLCNTISLPKQTKNFACPSSIHLPSSTTPSSVAPTNGLTLLCPALSPLCGGVVVVALPTTFTLHGWLPHASSHVRPVVPSLASRQSPPCHHPPCKRLDDLRHLTPNFIVTWLA